MVFQMKERRPKTLVIGVDGFDPDLFSRLIRRGDMPTLGKLTNNGLNGRLKSTIPPSTCPAWVSSVTGVNVGKHGIYDFFTSVDLRNKAVTFANSMKRRASAVWNIASRLEKKCIILNVPVTFPPERIEGVMVSGMLTPGLHSDFTYPRSLKHELLGMGYQIDIGDTMVNKLLLQQRSEVGLLSKLRELVRTRTLAAEHLMKEFEWDLFMVVYVALDRLYHLFWRHIDPEHVAYNPTMAKTIYPYISHIHLELDRAIGRLLNATGKDANLLLYSDHGFRPLNRILFTNSVLRRMGFLEVRKSSRISRAISQESILKMLVRFHLEGLLDGLPANKKRRIGNLIRPSDDFASVTEADPAKTKAFQFGYNYIRINEDSTSVEEQTRIEEEVLDLFNNRLSGLFIRAYRREDLFHGPMVKEMPRIILESQGDVTPRQLIPVDNRILMDYDSHSKVPSLMWNGDHGLYGVIVAAGPSIKNMQPCANGLCSATAAYQQTIEANIVDIAPTILEMLGIPIPSMLRMDGKSIIGKGRTPAYSV